MSWLTPASMRLLGLPVAAGLILAACAGGGDGTAEPTTETTSPSATLPGSSAAADVGTVRYSVDSFVLGAQVHVAQARGLFDTYGIRPDINVFATGIDGLDAVLSGQSDMAFGLDFATLTRLPTDRLRIVSAAIEPLPGFHKLAVRDGISQAADLAGTKMGVAEGTLQQYVTARYLEVNGLEASSVEQVPFTSVFEIVGALRARQIDAAWVWAQGVEEATAIPGVTILTDDSAAQIRSIGYVVASRSFLEERPEAVAATLAAFAEATDWMTGNLPEASEIVAEAIGADAADVLPVMERQNYTIGLKAEYFELLQTLADFMLERGVIETEIDAARVVVAEPLRQAAPDRVDLG